MNDEEEILIKKLSYCEQEYEQNGYLSVGKFKAIKQAINLIEKQSKEIEELKEKDDANLAYYDQIYQNGIYTGQKAVEDKIKAKIEEMDIIISKNEQIRFNGRYEHLHTLTEARIVKGEMQSLL